MVDEKFNDILRVEMDGILIEESHYDVKLEENIIIVKADFLKTFCEGTHELTIVYKDGKVSASFQMDSSEDVDTGDSSRVWVWMTIFAMALASIVFIKKKGIKGI
ncbi:MAG: hypothetical protein PHW47_09915 [Lachnospira sp.]|nr:hypothetical protein [Lachnospira sp.]